MASKGNEGGSRRRRSADKRSAEERAAEEWAESGNPQGAGDFEEYDPERADSDSGAEAQTLEGGVDTFGDDPDLLKARDELEARLGGLEAMAEAAAHAAESNASGLENIVGIGVGFKETAGRPTADPAVKVFVQEKLAMQHVAQSAAIPSAIAGMATDVEQVGEIHAQSYARRYSRPVPCGVSCGHTAVTAGTLGCLVVLKNNRLAILSNNHVLANENDAAVGDRIIQPGRVDGGNASSDVIGVLEQFVPIRFPGPNRVDAAVAWTSRQFVRSRHVTYSMNPTPLTAQLGMSVMKNGRTTQSTLGMVTGVHVNGVRVRYQAGVAIFNDQVAIRGVGGATFSQGGDSGSVITTAASKQPVALLFAGSGTHTFANPISAVIRELGIRSFLGG